MKSDRVGALRLGDEGSVDDQRAALVVEVVQPEGGVLRLDVDGQARRREEAVVLAVAPSEVSSTAIREGEVRVLRGHGGDDVVRRGEGDEEPAGLTVAADPSKVALDTRRSGVAVAGTFDRPAAAVRREVAQLQPLTAS